MFPVSFGKWVDPTEYNAYSIIVSYRLTYKRKVADLRPFERPRK